MVTAAGWPTTALPLLVVVLPVPFCTTMPAVLTSLPLKIMVNGPPGPPRTVTLGTGSSVCGSIGFRAGIDNRWAWTWAAVGDTPGTNGIVTWMPPS